MRYSDSNGKTTESSIHTGVEILPQHFKNGDIIIKTPNYSSKRLKLDSIISDIEKIISELQSDGVIPYPKVVKDRYENLQRVKEINSPKLVSFWGGYDEFLETKKHKSRGYTKMFTSLKNRLMDFEKFKKIKLTFDYVTGNSENFQSEIQNYFWGKKKLSNNYVNKLFEILSIYLLWCNNSNYISHKPSFKKNGIYEIDEKIYLNESEVFKLFNSNKWDYVEGKDFSKNPHIYIITDVLEGTNKKKYEESRKITNWELVKDIFLFQCSIGCRYSDILHFKVNHFDFGGEDGRFSWVQQKTNKRVSVPVNPISSEIYRKYSRGKSLIQNLFPTLSNQKFNKSLKLLMKDLQFNRQVSRPKQIGSSVVEKDYKFLWELISSHSGRKTFVKNLIDLGTMDYKTIMKLTGHKTFREFEKYVSVTDNDMYKGKQLYNKIMKVNNGEENQFIDLYNQLDDKKKEYVIYTMKTLLSN
jgi:integrase